MTTYHKIPTVFERDPETKFKTLIHGTFATPELQFLQDCIWEFTEKINGTNIRVAIHDNGFSIGGRTDNAQIHAGLYQAAHIVFAPHADWLVEHLAGAVLYGEGYGAKIQKGGGNYSDRQEFALFDIRASDLWLRREDVADIATRLTLELVPLLGTGTLAEMVDRVQDGITSVYGDFPAEGIVARPVIELQDRRGNRIITKLKHKDFEKGD